MVKDYPPPPPTPKKRSFGSLPAPRSGYATTMMLFFAHLLILEYPDHHQNLISSSLYYPGPHYKISSQSVHNFLSNVVHKQTNRQTNVTKNVTSLALDEALGERRPPWPRQIITPISCQSYANEVHWTGLMLHLSLA